MFNTIALPGLAASWTAGQQRAPMMATSLSIGLIMFGSLA
jgi:hypothetical protein